MYAQFVANLSTSYNTLFLGFHIKNHTPYSLSNSWNHFGQKNDLKEPPPEVYIDHDHNTDFYKTVGGGNNLKIASYWS